MLFIIMTEPILFLNFIVYWLKSRLLQLRILYYNHVRLMLLKYPTNRFLRLDICHVFEKVYLDVKIQGQKQKSNASLVVDKIQNEVKYFSSVSPAVFLNGNAGEFRAGKGQSKPHTWPMCQTFLQTQLFAENQSNLMSDFKRHLDILEISKFLNPEKILEGQRLSHKTMKSMIAGNGCVLKSNIWFNTV